jgi:HD-like signal output (HDOD) protein
LHDVGKLVVLKAVDHLEHQGAPTFTPGLTTELMHILHAELGNQVLGTWRISEAIRRVALHHHDATPPGDDLLLLRVQVANAVTKRMGAHPVPQPDLNLLEVPAVERLNLGDLELASLMVDLEDEFERLRTRL